MDLAFAGASDRFFLLELTFDGLLPGAAISAHELCGSTWPLVVVQHLSCELEMALLAALHARIWGDIARREAACRAGEAHGLALVQFGVLEHFVVERVSGQHRFASLAAAGIRFALALDAVLRVAFEGSGIFVLQALGAGMAGCAP